MDRLKTQMKTFFKKLMKTLMNLTIHAYENSVTFNVMLKFTT